MLYNAGVDSVVAFIDCVVSIVVDVFFFVGDGGGGGGGVIIVGCGWGADYGVDCLGSDVFWYW